MKTRKRMKKGLLSLLVLCMILLAITPFFMMLSTSIKSLDMVTQWPPKWIPDQPQWENYLEIWKGESEFKTAFFNSLIVSGSTMLLCIGLGTFAAYAVSRFDFAGRKFFLFVVIITQMFSAVILIGPMYKIVTQLGLLNSYTALIIPNTAFSLPMTVWLLYGYLDGIPLNLEEAARMDGCTRVQAVWKILMPLLAPGMITSGLFAFIVSWNDLLFAQSFITKTEMRTISLALTSYKTLFTTYWHTMMAASTISVAPVFLLFIGIQKYLVKGLSSGGVKE